MSKKKATKRKSGLCCACLGSGKYQREHNAAGHWHLEKFSETHWSIIGRIKTLNDGESREEVVGVAEYHEAVRIRDNHNGEIDELIRIVRASTSCSPVLASVDRLLRDSRALAESQLERKGA